MTAALWPPRQYSPALPHPERWTELAREPKRICRSCPVRLLCLEYALERDERFGIWGGMSERERRRIRRQRPELQPAEAGPGLCGNDLHLMDEANTYITPAGKRHCRECSRAASRRRAAGHRTETEMRAA